jgi:hypothetical protein
MRIFPTMQERMELFYRFLRILKNLPDVYFVGSPDLSPIGVINYGEPSAPAIGAPSNTP